VNSDVEVTANWLSPIIDTFRNEPQTAIVQPKILDFKNKEYFEYAEPQVASSINMDTLIAADDL
jgi:GT2 family glycosyltransferase